MWKILALLYGGAVAWIALGLPKAEGARLLGWMGAVSGAIGAIGLLASIVTSNLEDSVRLAEATRARLKRVTEVVGPLAMAGFAAFLGAAGPKLILDGHVLSGVVVLGGFAVIAIACIVAPSEV